MSDHSNDNLSGAPTTRSVEDHYRRTDLGDAILGGLRAAGKSLDALTPDDLAPADHFHARGKVGTLELAHLAEISRSMRVLDLGGGIGGPARTLASTYGCHVTVLDLTDEFCRTGEMLTRLLRLDHLVTFRHGSALDIPFDDASFDLVWTEHSSMNIPDKRRLYSEAQRVLRPGGRLAIYEIMAGPVAPVHFPVPWAKEPSISFLRQPHEIRKLLADLGFQELAWVDVTAPSLSWFRERAATMDGPLPPLGIHLLLGADFKPMFQSVLRNLEEDRLRIVQGRVATGLK